MINLPNPKKNETYLEFVDQEWNLWGDLMVRFLPLAKK